VLTLLVLAVVYGWVEQRWIHVMARVRRRLGGGMTAPTEAASAAR